MQTRLNKLGLTTKIVIPCISIILLILIFFSIYLINNQRQYSEQALIEKRDWLVNAIAESAQLAIWNFDEEQITSLAATFFADKELISLKIQDHNGNNLVLLQRNNITLKKLSQKANIYYADRLIGITEIQLTNHFMEVKIAAIKQHLIFLSIFLFILAAIIMAFSIHYFLAPLTDLMHAVTALTQGEFNYKISVTSQDELGLMANSFNNMSAAISNLMEKLKIKTEHALSLQQKEEQNNQKLLSEIKERTKIQHELQIYQETLEKIVEERTSKLIISEARSQAIVNNAPVAIISMDINGNIISFNPHAENIFGYKQADILGKPMTRLIPTEFRQQHTSGLQHYIETGRSKILNQLIESFALHQSGKTFPIELRVKVMKFDNETFFTGMINDVSEQKAMHSQLLQAQKLESVGQLAAGIAHEINTPMQYITDNTVFIKEAYQDIQEVQQLSNKLCQSVLENNNTQQIILNELLSLKQEIDLDYILEEIPTTLEQTLEGLKQISKIISAMKSFSHPGMENKTSANLNTIISNTITISRNEWKYSAEIKTKLDNSLASIQLYPDLIGQVILNLIVNAAHAIKDKLQTSNNKQHPEQKGIIRIFSSQTADYQIVEVIDNGGGINESIKDKIFDPFFTTKDVGKGTGQGLSLAYSIITEKHQGKLEFENNEIGGTTFKISLPN